MKFETYKNIIISIFKKLQNYSMALCIANVCSNYIDDIENIMKTNTEYFDLIYSKKIEMFVQKYGELYRADLNPIRLFTVDNSVAKQNLLNVEEYILNSKFPDKYKDILVMFVHKKYLKINKFKKYIE